MGEETKGTKLNMKMWTEGKVFNKGLYCFVGLVAKRVKKELGNWLKVKKHKQLLELFEV